MESKPLREPISNRGVRGTSSQVFDSRSRSETSPLPHCPGQIIATLILPFHVSLISNSNLSTTTSHKYPHPWIWAGRFITFLIITFIVHFFVQQQHACDCSKKQQRTCSRLSHSILPFALLTHLLHPLLLSLFIESL